MPKARRNKKQLRRNAEICAKWFAGKSYAKIAKEHRLSRERVMAVIKVVLIDIEYELPFDSVESVLTALEKLGGTWTVYATDQRLPAYVFRDLANRGFINKQPNLLPKGEILHAAETYSFMEGFPKEIILERLKG